MIRQILLAGILLMSNQQLHAQTQAKLPEWTSKTGARTTPTIEKIYWVSAKPGSKAVETKAIQKAIDECAKKGGGIVAFKPGMYITGSLFLKSNVNLRIDKDVLLKGSDKFADYPDMDSRIAGIEMKWPAALINIIDQKNVSLTGEGKINANGKFNWDMYWKLREDYDKKGLRWIADYDAKRVRAILVQNSSDVTLKGFTVSNSGFWTMQLLYSDHCTVTGVTVKNNEDGSGPSTDGVDIDSSTWILVENCDIDCNDDNFCIKSGRDWDGLRVNRPAEYVLIRKCVARRGAGLITLGSETSGGIRHIVATELSAKNTDNGLRFKSATTRGGTIEDVYFLNSTIDSVTNVFQYNMNWYPEYSYSELPAGYTMETIPAHWKAMLHKVEPAEKGIPHAKDVYIENVRATNVKNIFAAVGLPAAYLENFVYTNCHISATSLGKMDYTRGWKFNNTIFDVTDKNIKLQNSTNMKFEE